MHNLQKSKLLFFLMFQNWEHFDKVIKLLSCVCPSILLSVHPSIIMEVSEQLVEFNGSYCRSVQKQQLLLNSKSNSSLDTILSVCQEYCLVSCSKILDFKEIELKILNTPTYRCTDRRIHTSEKSLA